MLLEFDFYVKGDCVPNNYPELLECWKHKDLFYFCPRIDLLSGDYVFKVYIAYTDLWYFPMLCYLEKLNCYRVECVRFHE